MNGTAAGTLLASVSTNFTASNNVLSGTLVSAVYKEAGGTLDFYYQVTNNPTAGNGGPFPGGCGGPMQVMCDPITRVTMINFTNFLTQLDFRNDAGVSCFDPTKGNCPASYFIGNPPGSLDMTPTVDPASADTNGMGGLPNGSADTVGYTYNTPGARILPGETSDIMIISTNATNYKMGAANVIDGGVTTVSAFAPSSAVPEPGSLALIGGGLLALAGIRRKFKRG